MHILFVEDEAKIANFVRAGLKEQGFVVDYCDNGDEGYSRALDNEYDAIVLDMNVVLGKRLASVQMLPTNSKLHSRFCKGNWNAPCNKQNLAQRCQQSLSKLLDEVSRLSGIIRKLLLLSLADAGQMNLHRVEVDLSGLLMEMLEDIELLAPNLEIQTEIAEGFCVQGDRDLLIQVLQNLISNAIKYNLPNGWIRIEAHRQSATVSITISNCSKEIPVSDQNRIFDRFHRGDPAWTRQVEGIGLGLSLAREIARAHGGDLTLVPTLSGQTAFTLALPVGL